MSLRCGRGLADDLLRRVGHRAARHAYLVPRSCVEWRAAHHTTRVFHRKASIEVGGVREASSRAKPQNAIEWYHHYVRTYSE